ncbi:M1 family metallopeptidase [Niabella terrae]
MPDTATAQLLSGQPKVFTRQDSLRGTNGSGRYWWDVRHYGISLHFDIEKQRIWGCNEMTLKITDQPVGDLQLDLQTPMILEKVVDTKTGLALALKREGNVYWVSAKKWGTPGSMLKLRCYFSGNPRIAVTPPWDGGWIFAKDSLGRPFISTAVQGLGASAWYPCKDYQGDEPEKGMSLTIHTPPELTAVSNGRLVSRKSDRNGQVAWTWKVTQPINNYNITPYIGHYVNFTDTLMGARGRLDLSYWVLDYNLKKARKHFELVKPMLHCFEYWMGPYPFYEDGYKLVDAPHLGMEHQSAVAYGNKYLNGYLGRDRSGSGWGEDWDFIIVHESGHEWFGNNITSKDLADMWVHESFTNYSETMFVECRHGKTAGSAYVIGQRRIIQNKEPIVGHYGVNNEGSGDMYDKGGSMLHTIRQVINDDHLFRDILRGLNRDFYHQTVTGAQVEQYFSEKSGKDLQKIFDQYLRTTQVPVLQYHQSGSRLSYKWNQVVAGFDMPVKLMNGRWIHPTTQWQTISTTEAGGDSLTVAADFYITVKKD